MLDRLTYKQKNIGLLVLTALVVYYMFSNVISDTLDMKSQYDILEEKSKQLQQAPQQIALLKGELSAIDKVLSEQNDPTNSFQNRILEVVSNYSNLSGIEVRNFEEPIRVLNKNYEIETNIVTVSGSFKELLQLVNELEQNKRIAQIMSVNYHIKKDFSNQSTDLIATIHFQNIRKL